MSLCTTSSPHLVHNGTLLHRYNSPYHTPSFSSPYRDYLLYTPIPPYIWVLCTYCSQSQSHSHTLTITIPSPLPYHHHYNYHLLNTDSTINMDLRLTLLFILILILTLPLPFQLSSDININMNIYITVHFSINLPTKLHSRTYKP